MDATWSAELFKSILGEMPSPCSHYANDQIILLCL